MPPETYSIADLARLTGVNVRTIRYYLAQGLLPASGESGPGAHYGEGHLDRLRLTRRLQAQHLPLSEIRRRLAELTDAEVSSVVAAAEPPRETPSTSALDYVRSVLGAPTTLPAPVRAPVPPVRTSSPHIAAPMLARLVQSPGAAPARSRMVSEASDTPGLPMNASRAPLVMPPMPGADADHAAAEPPPSTERSQWERLALTPDIELHIRRPLGRLEQRRVERLITIARQVLKEGKP